MNNQEINNHLLKGEIAIPGVLPHLESLKELPFLFTPQFGLEDLPVEPGVILIRGPRQYGKSTWLEQQIAKTLKDFNAGSVLYLNGDEIRDERELVQVIEDLIALFSPRVKCKRLFIDEITAVPKWEQAIKRLIDQGALKDILLVTTGSKAADLRHGTERLPGRKGKLKRTNYIFTPISYSNFKAQCADYFKDDTLWAYILTGGAPIAINALAQTGKLPEYIVATINDWVLGEFAAHGRSRAYLLAVLQTLYRMAGAPVGQAKLARESGLANNTLAQNYVDLLSDLLILVTHFQYDADKKIALFRKPAKFTFINTLAAIIWHPHKPRTIAELKTLPTTALGQLYEWVVAQEIWRRQCILADDLMPENLYFWQSKEHEIDFVIPRAKDRLFFEVKVGEVSPIEFSWFSKTFPQDKLTIIAKNKFQTQQTASITLEEFLLL